MYEEWTKSGRAGRYFFRPYIKESTTNHVSSVTNLECMKSTESCSVSNVSKTEQSSLSVQTLQDQVTPTDSSPPDSNAQFSQTLLWIQQEEWQQNLMVRYGNTMSLIDATYKTTKYDLPLFFVTVRTNVGYKVVAHFIVQSETTEQILEAVNILKN